MDLKYLGLKDIGEIRRNTPIDDLVQNSLDRGEGVLGMNGALMVDTGKYTGRSPKDRFIVDESTTSHNVWWGSVNKPISIDVFNVLMDKVVDFYNKNNDGSGVFVFDGFCGSDPETSLPVRFIAKKAWQAIFVNNMFIRPTTKELNKFEPQFTIINASPVIDKEWTSHGLHSETFIIFNLERGIAIIGGSEYGGEMKKGIFSVMNYYLPLKGILTMHCAANVDMNGENPALFFGLSGTGKTTLSTDPNRLLIGDDEHGWSDKGIFNLEGGCYAKAINLNKEAEPGIWAAIKHGALLENVVFDEETKIVDFSDSSKTENTRICYPLDHIEASLFAQGKPSRSEHPNTILFLSCDAYGILPPVSRLTPDQAMYHFISGYTAKVAGTERGVTEPQATFSPCFGGPFLTLNPLVYARLLREKMEKHGTKVYFINTGWNGGSAMSGAKRISLSKTREMVTAILTGDIEKSQFIKEQVFGLDVPMTLNGEEDPILIPRNTWEDKSAYDQAANRLAHLFRNNFKTFVIEEPSLETAGPII
ncbi:MAG: phosphoenolpyruvate carboxykinase (ATP) [Candidatus Marinimicrobia bacterium]|nr:phosphoenolpyruvate carboxykinase (ATP) [Candidatus Neomarinimicrobiota bacterium]